MAFGAIGIPIVVAAGVTGLDLMHISAIVGRQLPFLSIIVPLWLVVTMSGWKSAMEVLPAIIVTGVCFAVSQFVVSNFVGPYLPDIIAAIVTIIGLGVFLMFWKPPTIWRFSGVAPTEKVTCLFSRTEVIRAWVPYIILAIMVFLWGLDSVKATPGTHRHHLPIGPCLHNLVIKTAPIVAKNTPYPAVFMVNIGTAAGTAIFIAGLLSVLAIPNYGYGKAFACLGRTIKTLKWAIVTVSMILGLAWIMNYSGMSSTLGLAFTATGALFPIFSPILGWLGVFLTGSDTSSNALFGALQKTTAHPNRGGPHPHGGGQLQRRRGRQDDFATKHRGGHRGHRHGGGGRLHLPVCLEAQRRHGADYLPHHPAPGLCPEVDGAVSFALKGESVAPASRRCGRGGVQPRPDYDCQAYGIVEYPQCLTQPNILCPSMEE